MPKIWRCVGNLWRQLSLRVHWVSPNNQARSYTNGPFTETYCGEWTHELPTHSCPLHCSQCKLFYPFIEMHLKQWPSWVSFGKVGSVISHLSITSMTVCCKVWRENAVVTLSHTISRLWHLIIAGNWTDVMSDNPTERLHSTGTW